MGGLTILHKLLILKPQRANCALNCDSHKPSWNSFPGLAEDCLTWNTESLTFLMVASFASSEIGLVSVLLLSVSQLTQLHFSHCVFFKKWSYTHCRKSFLLLRCR